MESIFQASLKNNRIYFVFILDVAINSTDLKAELTVLPVWKTFILQKKKPTPNTSNQIFLMWEGIPSLD